MLVIYKHISLGKIYVYVNILCLYSIFGKVANIYNISCHDARSYDGDLCMFTSWHMFISWYKTAMTYDIRNFYIMTALIAKPDLLITLFEVLHQILQLLDTSASYSTKLWQIWRFTTNPSKLSTYNYYPSWFAVHSSQSVKVFSTKMFLGSNLPKFSTGGVPSAITTPWHSCY